MRELDGQRDGLFTPSSQGGARPGAGRKPGGKNSRQRIPESVTAPVVLNKAEERAQWRKLVLEAKDEKTRLAALQYINEMRRGKPFTATNPRERKQTTTDNTLMIAIQNLMPGSKRSSPIIEARTIRRKNKPRKLKANADTNE